MKRRSMLFLLAGCLTLLLGGCGEKAPEVTEITLIHGWGSTEQDHVAMRQIYQDFEKTRSDIRLNLVSMPTAEEVVRKAVELSTVGQVPDILFFGGTSTPSVYQYMADHHLLLDLMPYIQEDETFAQSISDEIYRTWQREDGTLYTLCDTLLLSGGYWYNRALLAQAGIQEIPTTWSAFFQMKERFEAWAAAEMPQAVLIQPSADGYLYLLEHFLAEQGVLYDPQSVTSQQIASSVVWAQRHFPVSETVGELYSYRDETNLFNQGELALYINGVWASEMIDESIDAEYALLPSDGASFGCISANIGYVLGKTGDEKRQQASVAFLKYILSQAVQERILTETGQMPSNPSIHASAYAREKPRFCQAVATVSGAQQTLATPEVLFTKHQTQVLKAHILGLLQSPSDPRQTLLALLSPSASVS